MTDEQKRQILLDVAEGRLDPSEAAERLDSLSHDADPAVGWAGPGQEARPGADRATRVRVEGTFGILDVRGDAGVHEAVAEGPHAVHREGDTLVIRAEVFDDEGFQFVDRGRPRRLVINGGSSRPLSVRMRPDLPLEVDLDAGKLSVRGLNGPIAARVSAGPVRVEDASGPVDVHVSAGKVSVAGRLVNGRSKVDCDAGAVRVDLERGSSVQVRVQTDLGKVRLPGRDQVKGFAIGGSVHEATVGAGEATLDIHAAMGSVTVSAE